MCGIPASGKSSWIEKNKKSSEIIVSLDEIRSEIFGHQFHRNAEEFVIGVGKSMVKLLLKQNKNVIVDSTALTRGIRLSWIEIAKQYGAKTRLVVMATDNKECIKRNRKRSRKVPEETMRMMMGYLDVSSEFFSEEKFDKVIIVR